jgi:hypothetical protein
MRKLLNQPLMYFLTVIALSGCHQKENNGNTVSDSLRSEIDTFYLGASL